MGVPQRGHLALRGHPQDPVLPGITDQDVPVGPDGQPGVKGGFPRLLILGSGIALRDLRRDRRDVPPQVDPDDLGSVAQELGPDRHQGRAGRMGVQDQPVDAVGRPVQIAAERRFPQTGVVLERMDVVRGMPEPQGRLGVPGAGLVFAAGGGRPGRGLHPDLDVRVGARVFPGGGADLERAGLGGPDDQLVEPILAGPDGNALGFARFLLTLGNGPVHPVVPPGMEDLRIEQVHLARTDGRRRFGEGHPHRIGPGRGGRQQVDQGGGPEGAAENMARQRHRPLPRATGPAVL